jgi:hypothetical protein
VTRTQARTAVADWFSGTVAGLTKVYPTIPKHGIRGEDYAGGDTTAVGVVHIATSKETRLSPPAGGGRKLVDYSFWLVLDARTVLVDVGDTAAAFDSLIEATLVQLRSDPTMAGAFTQIGEGADITVVCDVPVENGRLYQQMARIEFVGTQEIQA